MTRPTPVTSLRALKVRPGGPVELPDQVVTEEPLEIRLAGPAQEGVTVAVTMRTPGQDFELAAGFVYTEGLASPADIAGASYCEAVRDDPDRRFNTVTVHLRRRVDVSRAPRGFVAGSSCGVCGKASIDEVIVACEPVANAAPLPGSLVAALPGLLRNAQRAFDRTGGLHAAGLFDPTGVPTCVREDVGRHNALDKIAGHCALKGPARESLAGWAVMVSGRVSFEIVQKAAMAGAGAICAVSAPSSLAVRAADRLNVGLAGFVRGQCYNIYTHPERFDLTH